MAIVLSGSGIDMGNSPISNASQIDSVIMNENGDNVATIGNLISKNLLINPNFLVNQRGYVSGTNTTVANQYCHDRWRVVTSGQNVTFTTTNNVVTVTAPAGGYEQVIENINVQSGDYKISHEGTATISVAESTDNVTYTTLSLNANGTYTLTGGKYVRVRFSSGTIIKPQVEFGSVRTSFENRSIGLEELLCMRYYEKRTNLSLGATLSAAYLYSSKAQFFTRKRVAPSISNAYYRVTTGNAGSIGIQTGVGNGDNLDSITFYNPSNNWTVNAGIDVTFEASAEL